MCRTVWGTLRRTFWEAKTICCKEPQRQTCHFAPRPLLWLKAPKLTLLGKKCTNELKELGDKCKGVIRENLFGNERDLPQKTRGPRRICPKEPKTPRNLENLGETLVEPWRNLGGTFRGTFWQPKRDLPQRTIESPKAILPRNLYHGWRAQSYCCWGTKKSQKNRLLNDCNL